jgi:hypothetical protein
MNSVGGFYCTFITQKIIIANAACITITELLGRPPPPGTCCPGRHSCIILGRRRHHHHYYCPCVYTGVFAGALPPARRTCNLVHD